MTSRFEACASPKPAGPNRLQRAFGWVAAAAMLASAPSERILGQARPQGERIVAGRVVDAVSGDGLRGASVTVSMTGAMAHTREDGGFSLFRPPGAVTLHVSRPGYLPATVLLETPDRTVGMEVALEPSPIALEGIAAIGSTQTRRLGESMASVSVLAGDQMERRAQETLAGALAGQPGIAMTGMSPAAAQPVIRGLGAGRILVLEDGVRIADISDISPDHATAVEPGVARRIEVLRGPSSLLYGGSALGGVVNVVRDEAPRQMLRRATGSISMRSASSDRSIGGYAQAVVPLAARVPLRLEASARRAGDLSIPSGSLENTDSRSWTLGMGSSWVADDGFAGASVSGYRHHYGIPGGFVGGHLDGVRTEMQRFSAKARSELWRESSLISRLQAVFSFSALDHSEFESPAVLGTGYERDHFSAEAMAHHSAWGLGGTGILGVRAEWEAYRHDGLLATPDARRYNLAAFVFQEIDAGPLSLGGGARYDWTMADVEADDPNSDIGNVRDRTFGAASASLSALLKLSESLRVGTNLARAFRTPLIGELYSEGPHLAAYVYEIGNPDLDPEVGAGADLFLRINRKDARFELTGFYNVISGYIYSSETGKVSRVQLPVWQYESGDARMIGVEGSMEARLPLDLGVRASASYIRGELRDTGDPLPLMPPLGGQVALEFDRPLGYISAGADFAARQDRLGPFEDATDGYVAFHAAGGLRLSFMGRLHLITAQLNNIGDRTYRNHLSRIKEIAPEAGRDVRFSYRVIF